MMIVFDIETTGLEVGTNDMISLGAVSSKTKETFYEECAPYRGAVISKKALEINGTEVKDLWKREKKPIDVVIDFYNWCAQQNDFLLGGINIGSFDVVFLKYYHSLINQDDVDKLPEGVTYPYEDRFPWGYRFVEIGSIFFSIFGELKGSDDICKDLDLLPEEKPHNALNGALKELEMFEALEEAKVSLSKYKTKNILENYTYDVSFSPNDNQYYASVSEFPGLFAAEKDPEASIRTLMGVLDNLLSDMRKDKLEVPPPIRDFKEIDLTDSFSKIEYVKKVILPELGKAFARGDKKYSGAKHFKSLNHQNKSDPEDIRHVRDCHVNVRLLEAEDLSEHSPKEEVLSKIVSAIGYLVILYYRVVNRG